MSSENPKTQKPDDLSARENEETPEKKYESFVADQGEKSVQDDPDVLLDVPVLNVEEIDLELEDLRVHISLRTELAGFVKVNVGIDAYLNNVKLNIKGVEARAQLKVRLDRILSTFNRALEAIDNNPQILEDIVGETDDGDEEPARKTTSTADHTGEEADDSQSAVRSLEEEMGENDRGAGIPADSLDSSDAEQSERSEDSKDGDSGGRILATDAARRRARQLEVDLSSVTGTGSGGRILVRDVRKTLENR